MLHVPWAEICSTPGQWDSGAQAPQGLHGPSIPPVTPASFHWSFLPCCPSYTSSIRVSLKVPGSYHAV